MSFLWNAFGEEIKIPSFLEYALENEKHLTNHISLAKKGDSSCLCSAQIGLLQVVSFHIQSHGTRRLTKYELIFQHIVLILRYVKSVFIP